MIEIKKKHNIQNNFPKNNQKRTKNQYHWIISNILTLIIAIIVATTFKSVFYENYKIPSGSMNPLLIKGDRILVSKFYYGYSRFSFPLSEYIPIKSRLFSYRYPQRGDVVVFKIPNDEKNYFYIKRIIGISGDQIQIKEGIVYVNNIKIDQTFSRKIEAKTYENENLFNVIEYNEENLDHIEYPIFIGDKLSSQHNTKIFNVPEGQYFMMGDNRDNSKDSRFHDVGTIPFDYIVGRAEIILYSINFSTINKKIKFDRIFNNLVAK